MPVSHCSDDVVCLFVCSFHSFFIDLCRICIRNYVENGFTLNGQCFFTCLNPNCQYEYSAALIGRLLPPTLFSRLLTKIQQEELRRANIPNFEQCKFCTFGTSKTFIFFQMHQRTNI